MDDGIKFFNGLPVVCGAQRRRAGCGAGHIFDTLLARIIQGEEADVA